MPWFHCFVRGENFPLKLSGPGTTLTGFYTTRSVEAADEAEAELACIALLRTDASLAHTRNPNLTPMMYVETVEQLEGAPEQAPGSGFTFFAMDD
jgi:hypothetical protein